MSEAALNQIRDLIQQDIGNRGLRTDATDNLISACFADFRAACHNLAKTANPSLAVVTGFCIPHAQPPCGETDGPLGALFLARALTPLGVKVVLATDDFCTRALAEGLSACGLDRSVALIVLPPQPEGEPLSADEYGRRFRHESGELT